MALIREAADMIDGHMEKMEKDVDAGEGDDINLLRLRSSGQIWTRAQPTQKARGLCNGGVAFFHGSNGAVRHSERTVAAVVTHGLGPMCQYILRLGSSVPRVNMAAAGVIARREALRLERARYMPDLGLTLGCEMVLRTRSHGSDKPISLGTTAISCTIVLGS